jgi:hypothetical protein
MDCSNLNNKIEIKINIKIKIKALINKKDE